MLWVTGVQTCALPISAIDGIVHALVLFDKRLNALILGQPLGSAIIRARILHDMFEVHALIRDRGNAQFQPVGISETGCDDGKTHAVQRGKRLLNRGIQA